MARRADAQTRTIVSSPDEVAVHRKRGVVSVLGGAGVGVLVANALAGVDALVIAGEVLPLPSLIVLCGAMLAGYVTVAALVIALTWWEVFDS